MAMSGQRYIVEPKVNGHPGILVGTGAPGTEVYPAGTLYIRLDAYGLSWSDGAGTWSAAGSVTDVELTAIAALTSAANKLIRYTGSGTAELIDCTAAGAALLDDASADAQLTTLGVTAAAKTILDDTTVGAIRTTLGVGTGDSPTFVAVNANLTGNVTGNVSGSSGSCTGNAATATNATTAAAVVGSVSVTTTELHTPGSITNAAGTDSATAAVMPAGVSAQIVNGADDTKGVRIDAADAVTNLTMDVWNNVANKILKIYPPTGHQINGAAVDAAFSTASGAGARLFYYGGGFWMAQ